MDLNQDLIFLIGVTAVVVVLQRIDRHRADKARREEEDRSWNHMQDVLKDMSKSSERTK